MSKNVWHTKRKKAKENKTIFAQHKSILRGVDYFIWEPQEFTDAIRKDVISWCYLDDLLVLETELERTRKALDVAVDALKEIDKTRSVANHKIGTQDKTLNSGIVFCWTTPDEIHNALYEITALEQKDK